MTLKFLPGSRIAVAHTNTHSPHREDTARFGVNSNVKSWTEF